MLIHACSVPCVPEDIHENVRMCMMFVYIFFCFYSVFYVINAVQVSTEIAFFSSNVDSV